MRYVPIFRYHPSVLPSGQIIKLNIGGTIFQTTESTLTKFGSIFKTKLETGFRVKKDESGFIFIDRDPLHFRLILNYMRDGRVELPDSVTELKELQTEAQYYLLTGLVQLCNAKIPQNAKIPAKAETSSQIRVIETEDEYYELTRKPTTKKIMIFQYHVSPNAAGSFPPEFNISSFLENHKNNWEIYFKLSKPQSGFASHWTWSLHDDRKNATGGMQRSNVSFLETIELDIERFLKYGMCSSLMNATFH